MIKWIIVIGIILSGLTNKYAKAQSIETIIDSLATELKKTHADTTKTLLLAELSYRYYTIPDSAISIGKKGLALATSIDFRKGIAANQVSIGSYYAAIGSDVRAFENYLKALEWQQAYGSAQELGRTYLLLGFTGFSQFGPEKAASYFKKALIFFERSKNSADRVQVLNNLGVIYTMVKKYDSALFFLDKGIDLARKTKQLEFEAVLLGSIGEMYIDKKDFKKAKYFMESSIELNKNFDMRIQSINYLKIAQIYKSTNQPGSAISSAKRSLRIATEKKDLTQIEQASRFLYDIYLEQQDYKMAVEYLKTATLAHDSIYSIEKSKEVQRLTNNFELKEKEAEIKILQQDNSLQQIGLQLRTDSLKRQRFILLGLMLVLILLAILLTWYRMINRIKRELEIERIRNNISKDLHDDIGSTLSSIKIISKLGTRNETLENAHRNFFLIESHSTKIMSTMADIVWSINSNNDTMERMVLYMKEFSAEILEPQNINYNFALTKGLDALKIDVTIRKNLFLIFKEAVNNAVKYSGCTEIRIKISFQSGILTLEITDNGRGFDFQQIRLGNGLNNMKERASIINAQIEIKSEINRGTGIYISTAIT